MLNFKSLTTGVAATALVSVIGLVYAQTSTYSPSTTDSTANPTTGATTTSPGSSNTSSDTMNSSSTATEPKADRN